MWLKTQTKNALVLLLVDRISALNVTKSWGESCAVNNRFTHLMQHWSMGCWIYRSELCRCWVQLQLYERMIYYRNVDASLERHFVCKEYRDSEKWCAYFILGYNFASRNIWPTAGNYSRTSFEIRRYITFHPPELRLWLQLICCTDG